MVDVEEEAGVGVDVRAGESNASGVGRAGSGDGELNASDVGLHSVEGVPVVEREDLPSKQVVSGGDVRRNGDVDAALVVDQPVHSPLTIGGGVAVLVDLEPHVTSAGVGLGEVDDDGAQVGDVDDVVGGSRGVVVPLDADGGSSSDGALSVGSGGGIGQPSTRHICRRNQRNRAIKSSRGVRAHAIAFCQSLTAQINRAQVCVREGTRRKNSNEPENEEYPRQK